MYPAIWIRTKGSPSSRQSATCTSSPVSVNLGDTWSPHTAECLYSANNSCNGLPDGQYGRAISIGLCVAWWVVCIVGLNWYEDWPYVSQTMLAIPIMPLVTGYLAAVALLYLLYRAAIHCRAKEYNWRKDA